jgi:hypothetical protein
MGRPKKVVSKVDISKVDLLFTVVPGKEHGNYNTMVILVKDGVMVDSKLGNEQLLHHANQLITVYLADYLAEYSANPEEYFEDLEVI